MTNPQETLGKTLCIVCMLSLFCSIVVAGSAVGLKKRQEVQKQRDKQRNVLAVAGFPVTHLDDQTVHTYFQCYITPRVVDLASGQLLPLPAESIDEAAMIKDPTRSRRLTAKEDIAKIQYRPHLKLIYFVKDKSGKLAHIVLPLQGSGLWSMMSALLAVRCDGNTISGLTYYDQAETPGLGGEVANPNWQKQWQGKQLFDSTGKMAFRLVKGGAKKEDLYGVDALSGATATSNGVQRTLDFWLGINGYGPFLARVRQGALHNE